MGIPDSTKNSEREMTKWTIGTYIAALLTSEKIIELN